MRPLISMLQHIVAPQALNSETPVSAYVWHLENIIVIMKKEEEDLQGPGKPCELIISNVSDIMSRPISQCNYLVFHFISS